MYVFFRWKKTATLNYSHCYQELRRSPSEYALLRIRLAKSQKLLRKNQSDGALEKVRILYHYPSSNWKRIYRQVFKIGAIFGNGLGYE